MKVDRMSMANSLEVRCPLLDHKLAEFAARIPHSWKMKNGRGKQILLEAIGDRLPPELLNRAQDGFRCAAGTHWFRESCGIFCGITLTSDRFLNRGMVSKEVFDYAPERARHGRRENSHWLWALLMLESVVPRIRKSLVRRFGRCVTGVRKNGSNRGSRSVFLLSAVFVLYVLAGYPLLLAIRARGGGRPVAKAPSQCPVTLLLAVKDGERFIASKLRSILELDYPRDLLQVIVISDGSTDSTDRIVAEFAPHGVELLRVPPGGKAAALTAGMARASGEILFFTDVRQRLAPESLRNLVACFSDPHVGVASGELIILDGQTREEASVGLYWRYEKWMRRRLSQIDSVMGATGCIYCIRRSLAVPLPADTLLDDVYLPVAAFFRGYRVIWDDSAKAYDYPAPLDAEFRRKIRTQAGVYQLLSSYPQLRAAKPDVARLCVS